MLPHVFKFFFDYCSFDSVKSRSLSDIKFYIKMAQSVGSSHIMMYLKKKNI